MGTPAIYSDAKAKSKSCRIRRRGNCRGWPSSMWKGAAIAWRCLRANFDSFMLRRQRENENSMQIFCFMWSGRASYSDETKKGKKERGRMSKRQIEGKEAGEREKSR